MTMTMTAPPPGGYSLAVDVGRFASVDPEDFGHALYAVREWRQDGQGVVRGCGSQKEVTLKRLVADRMELAPGVPVAHRDDDPLNCRRRNLYSTRYVWARGPFVRRTVSEEVRYEGKGKKKKEVREQVEHEVEEVGWVYGNVAVYQGDGSWVLIHVPTGRGFGAVWDKIAEARLNVELIHAEADFSTLPDRAEDFNSVDGKKWKDVINRRGRSSYR